MTNEYETLREVGHGINGIRSQLRLHVTVFGAAVAIACAAFAFAYNKLDRVEDLTARMDSRLESIEAKMDALVNAADKTNATLETIADASKPGVLEIPSDAVPLAADPRSDMFAGWKGLMVGSPADTSTLEAVQSLKADESPIWIYYRIQDQ